MRFAIIGCGMIANFHAKAIRDMRGSKLVACFNRTRPAAQHLADEYGCDPYDDLTSMLSRDDIDVVTICTPSGAHMEPTVAAAQSGKHVIVEKPLDVTLKRCDKMIRACADAGVELATIFPSRYHDSSILLKRAAEANRFGNVAFGDAYVKWFRTQDYYDSGAWRGTWELDGGGALMNQAIHSVDLLLWIMGPVKQVTAMSALRAHERIEVEDTVVATLEFESGALGTIQATTASFPGALKRIEISGDGGTAILEEEDIKAWEFAKKRKSDDKVRKEMLGKTETGGGAADPAAIGHVAHQKLFTDFVKSVKSGKPTSLDGFEGRRSVELILAIYAAAKTGKRISLPLKSDPRLR